MRPRPRTLQSRPPRPAPAKRPDPAKAAKSPASPRAAAKRALAPRHAAGGNGTPAQRKPPPPSAGAVVARLLSHGLQLAVAESCTGGLLGARITEVPGSSRVFLGGIIAYADGVKVGSLGVEESLIREGPGSVSAVVVESMAHGVRDRLGADIGIAVSGIAGPSGGSPEKPVGTVWLAVVGPERLLNVHKIRARGDRQGIREEAVAEALRLVALNLDEAEREGLT